MCVNNRRTLALPKLALPKLALARLKNDADQCWFSRSLQCFNFKLSNTRHLDKRGWLIIFRDFLSGACEGLVSSRFKDRVTVRRLWSWGKRFRVDHEKPEIVDKRGALIILFVILFVLHNAIHKRSYRTLAATLTESVRLRCTPFSAWLDRCRLMVHVG